MIEYDLLIKDLSFLDEMIDEVLKKGTNIKSFINSAFLLIKRVEEYDDVLYEDMVSLVGNIDIEYAIAIDNNSKLKHEAIHEYMQKIKSIIYKINNSIELNLCQKHILLGYYILDSLDFFREQLSETFVNLDQIIDEGKHGFGFNKLVLMKFVKYIILNLVKSGAEPCCLLNNKKNFFTTDKYGTKPEEIAENIIKEWQNKGKDPDFGDVWFAIPKVYKKERQYLCEKECSK